MAVRITVITLACVLIGMGFAVDANAQREWAPRLDGETQSDDGGGISFPLWLAVGPDYGTYSYAYPQSSEEINVTLYGLQIELTGRMAQFGSESENPLAVDVKLALLALRAKGDDSDVPGFGQSGIEDGGRFMAQLTPVARLFLKASRYQISPYGGYGVGYAYHLNEYAGNRFAFVHGLRLGCDIMTGESFGIGLSFQRTNMETLLDRQSVDHLSLELIFGL